MATLVWRGPMHFLSQGDEASFFAWLKSIPGVVAVVGSGHPSHLQRWASVTFASPELLWKILTAKRWELLKALCGAGPVSIREAARRVERDVKAGHTDVTALLAAGVVDRTESGAIVFPFEAVKVEFLLQASYACEPMPNPSIEWSRPGKPGHASHVKSSVS